MPFDPFKDGGATELKDDFDPFKDGSATEEQNYLADKARRLGRAIPKAIGDTVASAGSAVQSGAELAAEALRWRAVRSGDMTEAEAAAAKARLLDAASQTAPLQAAQAIRDVGQELTDVGPRRFAAPDPARNEEVGSAVTSGAASLVPLLAAGMAAPVAAIPAAAGYMGETQRQDAAEKGATPTQQAAAFALGAPVGAASEALLGVPALLASVRGAKAVPGALTSAAGGLDTMLAATVGKIAPAILPVAQQAVKSAVREGVQEGLEQIAQNTLAKDVVAYDPKRDRTEGAGMAMLAGSIVGGGVGAATQAGQELDTRRNLAESKATLLAQQQQLVRGLRPAQMFPVDAEGEVTNELPLPPEMARVETSRGVFHYNPALIDEATLLKLSRHGRENQPLGLGSQSKADVAARVAKGDPAVAVTERTPDGTEVKTAVATRGTAAQTTAELKASQTPGNTVQTEPLGQTIQERSGNFVADLLARDATAAAAQREATAKEESERATRQKDLDEKKARFDERLALARETLADPAAAFPAVDGALKTITSYAEDNALGLTQTQREQAAQTQAALQQRHAQLAPAATAAADAEAATRRAEAQLAADAKAEKVRRERAALQHLETTGRDLTTGKITDLTAVPDEELAALDPAAEGLAPTALQKEIERRGQEAERAAATENTAGYSLRDLILGKKAALAAAGRTQPLRLKTPAALALEGGTMAGEHRAIGERTGGFRIFADTGLAEDTLQEQLQQLGFTAPDVPTAYALYERALSGEDIRPERGEENQVDFASGDAKLDRMASGDGAAPQSNGSPQSGPEKTRVAINIEKAAETPRFDFSTPGTVTIHAARFRVDEIRRIGLIRAAQKHFSGLPENTFVRVSHNRADYDHLKNSTHSGSKNRRENESENGLSVGYTTEIPARYAYFVNGVIDSVGGDGEPVLKLSTAKPSGPLLTYEKMREKLDGLRETRVKETGWTVEQVRSLLSAPIWKTIDPNLSRGDSAAQFAQPQAPRPAAPAPLLTDTQVDQQLAALRREFPALTRDLDLRSGLVADELRTAGYRGPVPAGVQAAILQLRGEKRLLVIAAQAARSNQGAGLFLHEMAHPFFDSLPTETKTILRELHAQEMRTKTGPLFDAAGQLTTDVFVRADQFSPARLAADPDLPIKEWFAERVRALNADWLAGRIPRDHSTLVRVWRELLAKLRQIFARVRGLDTDSDLFTETFRRWLDTGARADLTRTGLAYAQRKKAEFASFQDTLDLGSTPLGLTLPNEIRNLAPRWQDKTLQFESSLDKALYYAGGTPGELRTRITEAITQQTQLTAGQIATLARDLRAKLAPLARTAATAGTIRVPAQMQPAARKLTGVDFATTAGDYVTRNGTPAAKVDAARADIERLLGIVADDQLDLFAYGTRGPDSARSAPLPRSDVERSGAVSRNADEAAALKNPTDSRALRTAYGIGERDAYGTTGTTRISSIIPELIADPKRTWDIRGATITTARDLVALVNVLRTPYVETTKIVFLNQSGEVVHSEIMSIGAIAAANLNPQMMARTLSRAPATVNGYDIIISHNHPSGNPTPSPADVKITRQIREVLRATPHRFRDHVVTNGDTYFSFAESGELGFETGAITTKKPTAAGPDAQNRAELGTLAPWEKVARGELRPINNPYAVNEIVAALRQVDPTALHIIYLNHKTNLTALERVPEFTLEQGKDTNAIIGQIFAGLGREGANQFIVAAPDVMPAHAAARLMRDLRGWANTADIVFLDFASKTLTPESTARSVGLMEGPAPQFATGPDATPKARLAEIEQRLADLSNSQEDAADIEARGRALTAERDQLRREIAAEDRTAATAAALTPLDTRHPLAVATPEPGDAWAMAPKMTDGELAAERERVTTHVHDNFAGLAPAERAALGARVQALTAEQIRRGLPTGATVTPIPKVDRRTALLAELARGRALRDEGDRTGNHAANAEGVRLVRLATDTLDAEFPGWDAKPPATQASTPPPPEPPPTEAAPANEGDGEQSPFSGAEEETMPVRRGKWNEVYGHSAYQPSFLARSWRKLRAVLTGIKGPIPELPTFPAAWWNRADSFIREQGAQFYARVSEGERALKSANDYIQRTAEEQLGQIITPLLNQGEKFNAEDYARLQSSQEKARRAQADGRLVPPGLAAEITALNSKMESSPYVLFNRLVFALDLHWRAQNLKDDRGSAITLPAGINAAETKAEVERLAQTIAAGPHAALIKRAVEQHMALVQQVAADLKSRELLAADHLANPYYFPHLTLEKRGEGGKIEQRELTPARVRPGTEADFRGYLETPVGSTKAIEQDYVRAMYYHLVQVGAHNFKADAVRDYFRPYDIKATVEARAKELSKQRGRPVSWEMAFNEEFAPRGYVKYGTDSRDAFPTLTVNRDALARRLGVMLSSEDIHRQLAALDQKGIRLLPEDIRETLSQGERETWIVPARVAEALRGIGDRLSKQDNALEAAAKFTLGIWKGWKLFMPWNHVRYEYGNVVADIEKLLSSSPGTFKQLPNAAKELRAFWTGGEPSADLRAALKEGVINAITAQEMDTLTRLKAFEAFQTRSQKAWDLFKRRGSSIVYQPVLAIGEGAERAYAAYKGRPQSEVMRQLGLGDFSSPELSALREAITRYAKFKNDLTAIRAGARPDYAGAYWKNIEAMTDSRPGAGDAAVRKAAAISKATFGDYGDLSVLGQTARDRFVPFYSWMEINFRYHANLLRNLRDMVQAGEMPAPAAAGKAAKTLTITAAGLGARTAGAIALRLALPYMAVFLWNNSGDRDELEKLLSEEDRRRFHIILGRDAEGKVLVAYGNTALMDVLKWFSGPKFAAAMGQWYAGKTDFATAVGTWKDELGPDLLNNTAGSIGPGFKIPYALAAKKATFPDITDQRSIPAYDMRRHILGQITDEFTADAIERTVNKDYYGSKDLTGWAKQLILQVRQRDPESWAFYAIKDKANDYEQRMTGTSDDSARNAPDQQVLRNFRRAIYRGDADMAVQFYQRLLDYGYTAERFQASIRSQDPLSTLEKKDGLRERFVASLGPDDRALLDRAYAYYQRISASRGREAQLFPRKASGYAGQMRYQAQPRTEALRAMMERTEAMTDEELRQRAQRDERRSLQRTQ